LRVLYKYIYEFLDSQYIFSFMKESYFYCFPEFLVPTGMRWKP